MSEKKNLIYACVFHNRGYIDLLKLLTDSINLNGLLSDNTDFLVICDTTFEDDIRARITIDDHKFKIYSMTKGSLFEAGCARLDIFTYPDIDNYDKILYLDTDILISNDVNPLLNNNIDTDKIYALEEGLISDPYHGKYYWDLKGLDPQTPAFISGILFFRNSSSMKQLFEDIKAHIHDDVVVRGNYIPGCLDQPFIVYSAVTQGKYDNKLMANYSGNFCGYDPAKHGPTISICHFCGSIGDSMSKYDRMQRYYNKHFINNL
jgi:hypothetical protein